MIKHYDEEWGEWEEIEDCGLMPKCDDLSCNECYHLEPELEWTRGLTKEQIKEQEKIINEVFSNR